MKANHAFHALLAIVALATAARADIHTTIDELQARRGRAVSASTDVCAPLRARVWGTVTLLADAGPEAAARRPLIARMLKTLYDADGGSLLPATLPRAATAGTPPDSGYANFISDCMRISSATDRALVAEQIAARRFRALVELTGMRTPPSEGDPADELIRWAYLTMRPPFGNGETGDVLARLETLYRQEIGALAAAGQRPNGLTDPEWLALQRRAIGPSPLVFADPDKAKLTPALERLPEVIRRGIEKLERDGVPVDELGKIPPPPPPSFTPFSGPDSMNPLLARDTDPFFTPTPTRRSASERAADFAKKAGEGGEKGGKSGEGGGKGGEGGSGLKAAEVPAPSGAPAPLELPRPPSETAFNFRPPDRRSGDERLKAAYDSVDKLVLNKPTPVAPAFATRRAPLVRSLGRSPRDAVTQLPPRLPNPGTRGGSPLTL